MSFDNKNLGKFVFKKHYHNKNYFDVDVCIEETRDPNLDMWIVFLIEEFFNTSELFTKHFLVDESNFFCYH